MKKLVVIAALALAPLACTKEAPAQAPASAPAVDLVGTWKNERGSELKVSAVVDGKLEGSYRSAVGKVDASQWFPVVGFARGDVVGFTVDFGPAGSVAAWSGQLEGDTLRTQWHLSRDVPDAEEAEKLFASMLSGSDNFVRE